MTNVASKDGKKTLKLGDALLERIEILAFVTSRDQTDIIRQTLDEGIQPLEEKYKKPIAAARKARKEAASLINPPEV